MSAPLTAFANAADVAAMWRPLSADEQAVANVRALLVSNRLRVFRPGVDAAVAASPLVAAIVRDMVASVVRRSMLAPSDGVRSQSQGTGPYSTTLSFVNPSGSVYFSDDDLALYDDAVAGAPSPAARSIRYVN
jgi:hypothetical protein